MSDTSQPETNSESKPDGGTPPLDRVRQEMERWLDVARTTGERALETLGLANPARPGQPAIDVFEFDHSVVVHVDLPGVAAEAVQLSLVGNMLTVKASRIGAVFPETPRRHLTERNVTAYERAIPLPAAIDADSVQAETRDGLLTITLHKIVAAPGRTIPVTRTVGAKPVETT